jgi:hypothetical protein
VDVQPLECIEAVQPGAPDCRAPAGVAAAAEDAALAWLDDARRTGTDLRDATRNCQDILGEDDPRCGAWSGSGREMPFEAGFDRPVTGAEPVRASAS